MSNPDNSFSDILYVIAIMFVVIWAINYFAYDAGNIIHILLGLAIIAVLIRIIKRNSI